MNNKFRRFLLNLSLLISVAASWGVTARVPIKHIGSTSAEDQVAQVERIFNAHGQLLTQLQQQLADNQRDIDLLRGQVQENQYQLFKLVEQQKQNYQQMNDVLSSQVPVTEVIADDANAVYNKAVSLVLKKKV